MGKLWSSSHQRASMDDFVLLQLNIFSKVSNISSKAQNIILYRGPFSIHHQILIRAELQSLTNVWEEIVLFLWQKSKLSYLWNFGYFDPVPGNIGPKYLVIEEQKVVYSGIINTYGKNLSISNSHITYVLQIGHFLVNKCILWRLGVLIHQNCYAFIDIKYVKYFLWQGPSHSREISSYFNIYGNIKLI